MKPFVCTFAFFVLLAPAVGQQAAPSVPDEPQQSAATQPEPGQANMSQADRQAQAAAEYEDQDEDQNAAQAANQRDDQNADEGQSAVAQPAPYDQQPSAQPVPSAEQQAQPPVQQPPYANQSSDPGDQPPYAGQQPPYPQQQPYPDQAPYPQGSQYPPQSQQYPQASQYPPDQDPYPQAPPVYYPQQQNRRARQEQPIVPAIRPRPEAADYPVSRQQQQFSVGARLLSPKEVEQRFSTPLGKRYIVVEVGVYPADAQALNLRLDGFTLRAGNDDQAFFPATPDDVLTDLFPRYEARQRDVRVYPSVGVGYESGGWGRGVSTGVGVGVGSGPYPRRGMPGSNRRVMQTELREKALPQGNLTQPAAGYLYFPLTGKRASNYTLELTRNGELTSLPLPNPKN